jgi:hypothetical protein
METGTQQATDQTVKYLVYALPEDNQAESLANYLCRHGVEAVHAGNEVTVPSIDREVFATADRLEAHWKLFWQYSEKELYGLPAYHKPACREHV